MTKHVNSTLVIMAMMAAFTSLKCIAMEPKTTDGLPECKELEVGFNSKGDNFLVLCEAGNPADSLYEYHDFDQTGKDFLLTHASRITSLGFYDYNEQLLKILPAFTALTSLDSQCVKPDSLIGLTRLRELKIGPSFFDQPYSFNEVDVATLTNLTSLEIDGIQGLPNLFSALAKNSNLKSLTIVQTRVRSKEIKKLTSLTELHVPNFAICEDCFSALHHLTALNVDDGMDVAAVHLKHLTGVRKLRVGYIYLAKHRTILRLPKLIDLTLAPPVDGINDDVLAKLTNLKRLDLRELGPIDETGDITQSGIENLTWIEELLWTKRDVEQ